MATWETMPGTSAGRRRRHMTCDSRRLDQSRPCSFACSDPAAPVGVACGRASEGAEFAQTAERVRDIAQALLGQHLWARGYWVASSGNVTDEVWAEYIKNQTPPEPDDNFAVTSVRRRADRSGFKP